MSHNLVFRKGNKVKDFPFQTPTKLTEWVLAYDNRHVQTLVIKAYLLGGGYTKEATDRLMGAYEKALDNGYTLGSN